MKKTKNPIKTVAAEVEVDAAHCTTPAQYAMRAECQADCALMRAVLGSWVTMWREDRCELPGSDGKSYPIPDVDLVFSMSADAPNLNEIRWLLDQLDDCHVGAQTVAYVADYTGERDYEETDRLMRRPNNKVIEAARECAKRHKLALRGNSRSINHAIERLDAEIEFDPTKFEKRAAEIARLLLTGGGGRAPYTRNKRQALNVAREMAKREYLESRSHGSN
jgi:hypothetical protein